MTSSLPHHFDHAAERTGSEYMQWGETFRREKPIAFTEAHGGVWVVSRYEDIKSIASNAEAFISGKGVTIPSLKNPVPVLPAESDGEMHRHYRSVLVPFLSPKAIKGYEPKIREIIVSALNSIARRGEGDAVADFAAKIPTGAVGIVFGFSDEDTMRFDKGITAVVRAAGRDPESHLKAVDSLVAFLREKLEERQSGSTGGDFVSTMLNYDAGGRKFTEEECIGLLWASGGAAIDTTKHAVGHAVHVLGIRPDIRQALRDDLGKIPAFVEEILRVHTPAQALSRTVVKSVSIGDVNMAPGDRVLMFFGWANRDEEVFPFSNELRIDRTQNKHLSFGYGVHQCVGMHLARLELKLAIEEVLKQIPLFELLKPGQEPQLHGGLMWCYDSIPIRV